MVILLITLFAQYGLAGYYTSVGNWSGNLHFANLVTLSIAMGLGVDYSIYMISRLKEELANGLEWDEKFSKWGFWLLTIGVLVFAVPTYIIGMHQTQLAHEMGYYYTRLREAIEPLKGWMWSRLVPDGMMIIGGLLIFYDLMKKTFLAKKIANK